MRTKKFVIPADQMVEFSDVMVENDLTNEIIGTTDDECISVRVSYENDQRQNVFNLNEWVENNVFDPDDDE